MDGSESQDAGCLVEVLAQLRQSGRDSVVADGFLTEFQRAMHVKDEIEDWVAGRIGDWRSTASELPLLVVLSGNAGDGKSDLIERLRARPEVAGADLTVIADATHAESPSESQAGRLIKSLAPFTSEPEEPRPDPECVLIAMNVGMVIAFFSAIEGTPDEERFRLLRTVLFSALGLSREVVETPKEWRAEVVNLDHRNMLGIAQDGIFSGMLSKLDPEEPESITSEAAEACAQCPVRACCWVRTNLNLLRVPAVRDALHDLLWEVSLQGNVHLSPRNVWETLFQISTGGIELGDGRFLSCDWLIENLPHSPQEFDADGLTLVQSRLLYNLLFEAPIEDQERGPILEALEGVDPIRRSGPHAHLAEGEVIATPSADANRLSEFSLEASEPGPNGESRRPDPLLNGFAALTEDPVLWHEHDARGARGLAHGVLRRARVSGLPAEIKDEVEDPFVKDFRSLLSEYSGWLSPGDTPPASLSAFWAEGLIEGVAAIFGTQVEGKAYFRLDTLSPTTRFPAFVPVELEERLRIVPDPVSRQESDWLGPLAYVPGSLTATIDAGGDDPWPVPVDLQLYKLLRLVGEGYAASSVDLEAFFRLRYACERLGGDGAETEVVFSALEDGGAFRLKQVATLGGSEISFERIGAN